YIEGTEKNILFDTGTKSDLFIRNFKELDIDHHKVDMVVISHEHGDHTGGLFAFLEMNHNLSVIMPYSFSYNFVRRVESYGARALAVKNPVEICKDVYLSGELDARMINEQLLAINTKKGLIVIGGCSHPGIINIIKNFQETLNRDIYLVFGGFHLMNKTEQEVNKIINQMKKLGVQKCGASHCTGDRQIQMFKEAFGDDYITMGVGRVITFNLRGDASRL
ncbi:MAG: MBL fold metallo-hydrolase, partial [Candidatus Aminicenantes bacterium]